jgi:hypothetical protein
VQPTEEVYEGMVIGENSRADDMDVNITKEKKLTNMRSSTSDSFESMTPPRVLTLEESLEFARDDECVEVTPEKVRIRKVVLDATERGRAAPGEAPGRQLTDTLPRFVEPPRLPSRIRAQGGPWRFVVCGLGFEIVVGAISAPRRRGRRECRR